MKNGFFRGHGLGNDYVVMDPKDLSFSFTPSRIKAICDRNWGLGSDGILALVPSKKADFGLRIFNPDGSEAEKSGNGLRIFARYLHATGKTKKKCFTVETKGGLVTITLHVDRHGDASAVTVEMGRATFHPGALPCTLMIHELIEQPIFQLNAPMNVINDLRARRFGLNDVGPETGLLTREGVAGQQLIDIAAPGHHLLELTVFHESERGCYVGFTCRALAIELDEDV